MGGGVLSRIVAVSNRVPLPKAIRAPLGGLETALHAALQASDGLWFGWSGRVTTSPVAELERVQDKGVEFATLHLEKRDYQEYYQGYSNRVLWPLLHSRLERMEYRRHYEEGYRRVNQLFARKLAPLLRDGDRIWVHDYHCIPLAQELRRLGCRQPIGFFLHVPFPGHDVFRSLPGYRRSLLELGSYDLLGFQTDVDLRGFQNSLRYGLPHCRISRGAVAINGSYTRTGVFPISIDVNDVVKRAYKGRASVQGRRLVESLVGRRLILGVDRLDYTKGLPERFRAFEQLLIDDPTTRGKFVFMQIAQPSRADVPEYQLLRRTLNTIAGGINGRFAEYDWVPIRYLNKGFGRTTILGFLSISGVALVTPMRDGMNLVAKEFVAAQEPNDPGVLVLSELAGAARELTAAVIVNPYDVEDVAKGLARAIAMPREERKDRWEAMMKVLRKNNIERWKKRYLAALEQSSVRGNEASLQEKPDEEEAAREHPSREKAPGPFLAPGR